MINVNLNLNLDVNALDNVDLTRLLNQIVNQIKNVDDSIEDTPLKIETKTETENLLTMESIEKAFENNDRNWFIAQLKKCGATVAPRTRITTMKKQLVDICLNEPPMTITEEKLEEPIEEDLFGEPVECIESAYDKIDTVPTGETIVILKNWMQSASDAKQTEVRRQQIVDVLKKIGVNNVNELSAKQCCVLIKAIDCTLLDEYIKGL